MKTLSTANNINIQNTRTSPDILVKFTGLTQTDGQAAQYTMGDVDGYIPGLVSVSAVKISVDPYGGLGHFGGVDMQFNVNAIKNILQNDDLTNEPVTIVAKYGTDADIPLWVGVIDGWDFDGNVVNISAIHDLNLKGKQLPDTQINATNYPSEQLPPGNVGAWVPLTIGTPFKPRGILINIASTTYEFRFNAALAGHNGIGIIDPGADGIDYYAFADKEYHDGGDTSTSSADLTDGVIATGTNGLVRLYKYLHPIDAAFLTGVGTPTNPERAINLDTSDYAQIDNPASEGGGDAGNTLRMTLPDFDLPSNFRVDNMYFYGKTDKKSVIGGTDAFRVGLEIPNGTAPDWTDTNEMVLIATGGDKDWNNVDGSDGLETKIVGSVSNHWNSLLAQVATDAYIPISSLSGRIMSIYMLEDDTAQTEWFRIYYAALLCRMHVGVDQVQLHGNISGYDDDTSGTYTGSASSLIETPSDVVYFIMAEIWGLTGWNASSITAARTAYGSEIIGGQAFSPLKSEQLLGGICKQSRMTLWRDASGLWNTKVFTLPSSADKTFSQNSGDFVSGADGMGEVQLAHSPPEDIYNQFEILYDWNEGLGQYNKTEMADENSAGALGTWMTDSQAKYNITRKFTYRASWISDDATAQAFRNNMIYRYADRKRMVIFNLSWNGLALEIGDTVSLEHGDLDITASGGDDSATKYDIYNIVVNPMTGIIKIMAMESSTSHAAL
jgi:hypothetical protein